MVLRLFMSCGARQRSEHHVKQVALSGHSGAYSYGHGHQKDDDEEGWMVARLDGKALEEDVSDPKKRKNDHPAYERERQSIEQDSETR